MDDPHVTPVRPAPGPQPPITPPDGGPAGPPAAPLGVGTRPTGHPGVDAQLDRLADVDHLDVAEHLAVYEDVHRALRDTLTALDQQPPGPRPGPRS
ncbi:hypothetical protein ACTWP5_27110 [Streptomyces sp. 4N509B]|uniref:hypothetical protein n=1 Tax=Streptomyces sp. 4N509B TaxID=3457413 RepID=UPI003FD3547E